MDVGEESAKAEDTGFSCALSDIGEFFYAFFKRAFDIITSLLAIIILSPVFLVAAIMIKREDGGPVIFKQTRVGLRGKRFTMYKFRSMCLNADSLLDKYRADNEMSGPAFKIKNDARITKAGKILRRTSIDELPQLFNVLRGDMSIIGPRPPLVSEVERYTEYQMHRLDVKTGLGCYREVMGRNNIKNFDDWVELDLKYIRERSLLTDAKIFFMMFKAVFTCEGAE